MDEQQPAATRHPALAKWQPPRTSLTVTDGRPHAHREAVSRARDDHTAPSGRLHRGYIARGAEASCNPTKPEHHRLCGRVASLRITGGTASATNPIAVF